MADFVNEGDYVVLIKSFDSGNMKIVQVEAGKTVHYGKLHFDTGPLVGAQYGDVFEIKGDNMIKVVNFESYNNELSELVSSNMSTFGDKTQFSQEKIIKKKKKKRHSNVVTIMRPTLFLLNEMLFARDKIGGLRADILSQIITSSNIQNESKILVLDHNLGMITSAVMSRILPGGVCIQLLQDYEVLQTSRKTMNMLNIREADHPDNLLSITIRDLYKISKGGDKFELEGNILAGRNKDHMKRLANLKVEKNQSENSSKKLKTNFDETSSAASDVDQLYQTLLRKESNRELRQRERVEAAKILKTYSLDSLIIIVQNDHPLPILKMIYQYLAPSRQFVIYSDSIEPLLECYQYLRTNSLAVSLDVSESWMRRYQVLPDRTRPEMNASGYGGFLMSGTKALYGPNISGIENQMIDET